MGKKNNYKIEALEERRAVLELQYQATNRQWITTLNEADKVPLKARLDDLDRQIEEIDAELDRLPSGVGGRGHLDWEAKLSKIDYKNANVIATDILNRDGFDGRFSAGGAAVFLLQDGLTMGAKWYVRHLLDVLTQMCGPGNVRHVPVEVPSYDRLDRPGVLGRLAEHFDVEPVADEGLYAQAIIDKIARSLRLGAAVLAELTIWDDLANHDWFLPWFLNDFWCPLVEKLLARVDEVLMARFVTVIVVNSAIAPGSLNRATFCTREQFSSGQLLELPLQFWEKKDILIWLVQHSGLSLNALQFNKMAQLIYQSSDGGKPKSVYVGLMEAL